MVPSLRKPVERVICPVAEVCGGCPQIHHSESESRAEKLRQVRLLLCPDLLPSSHVTFNETRSKTAYRNRVRLRILEDGSFGFFNENKSPDCAVLEPDLRARLRQLQEELRPFSQELCTFSHLELRAPDLDAACGLLLAPRVGETNARLSPALRAALTQANLLFAVECSGEEKWPSQRYPLSDLAYQHVPVGGFMQVNHGINQALIQKVCEKFAASGAHNFWDLYCGSGNFLLPVSAYFKQHAHSKQHASLTPETRLNEHMTNEMSHFLGVESNPLSAGAAQKAAKEQSLPAEFLRANVAEFLQSHRAAALASEPSSPMQPDMVLVDPPRAGLKEALPLIAALGSPHLLICSCNPKTLAQDLRALCALGYRPTSVELFDMFAFTSHVELLACLELTSAELS